MTGTRAALCSLILLAATLPVGCSRESGKTAPAPAGAAVKSEPSPLTPEQLAVIGAAVEKDPDRADELLRARGLTNESFTAAIRAISADREASRRYTSAFYTNRRK